MPSTEIRPRTRTGRPKFKNTDDVENYWAERLLAREPAREFAGSNSMSYTNDDLSHYGHFALATAVRRPNGTVRLVLLNGDRWRGSGGYGPSTGARQLDVERTVCRTGLPYLTVPFSALRAAAIDRRSIELLAMLRERWTVSYTAERLDWIEQRMSWAGTLEGDPATGYTTRDQRHPYEDDVRVNIEQDADGRYLIPHFRHWLGEAVFSAKVGRRRAKFLSAFDHNERRESYFMCELPRTSARTVPDAFEALKPTAVKLAIHAGLDVLRQGDIFAIPTSLTTRELTRRAREHTIHQHAPTDSGSAGDGGVLAPVAYRVKRLRTAPLLTTNHVATEQILTRDGDTYARGTLHHRPGPRRADHAPLPLGDAKAWYRIIKNTVPLAKHRPIGSPSVGAQQSGQSRAWTLGGQVD
jgi:hypothetical protein